MLIVTGAVVARPDTLDALIAEARRHVHQSRTEPGCVSHAFHIDGDDPLRIFFYERWTDMVALQVHFAQRGSQQLMTVVRDLAAAVEPLAIFEADLVSM